MNQKLVTVIMATKNSAKYLSQALDSVSDSGYEKIELLIVDANSSDGTPEVIRKYEKTVAFRVELLTQESTGLYNAWNQALDKAKGEYFAFLDSDDCWLKDRLKIGIDFINANPEFDYLISHFRFFLEQGCSVPKGFNEDLFSKDLIGRIPGTLLAHRDTFNKVGNFNQAYSIAGDVDWFARAKDMKLKLKILDQVLLFKRIHESNLSSFAEKNTKDLLKLLRDSIERQK